MICYPWLHECTASIGRLVAPVYVSVTLCVFVCPSSRNAWLWVGLGTVRMDESQPVSACWYECTDSVRRLFGKTTLVNVFEAVCPLHHSTNSGKALLSWSINWLLSEGSSCLHPCANTSFCVYKWNLISVQCRQCRLVAWHSGRTSVSGRRTFPVLRLTCSWWVTTNVGKPSATGQPTSLSSFRGR